MSVVAEKDVALRADRRRRAAGTAGETARATATVVFCGGGTGGHLTPGISVARALVAIRPTARVVFLLTGRAAEAPFLAIGGRTQTLTAAPGTHSRGRLCHNAHPSPAACGGDAQPMPAVPGQFERHTIPAVRWPRTALDLARFPLRWVKVRYRGARWIARLAPDAAVGLGGYGQYGPIRAAQRRGVPTILLEQNAVPGKANRLLSRRASGVCCQWAAALGLFPAGAPVRVMGNPIRETMLNGSAAAAHARFGLQPARRTLLVLGGSQGSRRLNQAMAVAVRRWPALKADWQVIHQSGPGDGETLRAAYAGLDCPHFVAPFLDELEMADAVAAADLVVSRAGATTLAELTATGRPAVLFPLPARDRHQQRNAEVLGRAGAAHIVTDTGDAERNGTDISEILCHVCEHPGILSEMARGSRRLGVRDAAGRVAIYIARRAAERRGRR